ncbi:MAG: hypothetical protein M5U01_09960 [Ardenticatenaceae bacterium]|nr:hypothetical protein [Ardenticatenaceae bacterium]
MPAAWTVIALTDRRPYARWLNVAVKRPRWHPFTRINSGGNVAPVGKPFWPLTGLVRVWASVGRTPLPVFPPPLASGSAPW